MRHPNFSTPRKAWPLSSLLAVCLFWGGCSSVPPPEVTTKNDFSLRPPKEHQTLPEDCKELTIELAQELALKHNPNFISISHAVQASWLRYYQSFASSYLSGISGNYGTGLNQTWSNTTSQSELFRYNNSLGASANMLVFNGLVREMTILVQRAQARQQELAFADARRILILTVIEQYYAILLACEEIEIAQSDFDFNLSLLKDNDIRYNAGENSLKDVLNSRINTTNAQQELLLQQFKLRSAKYALAALLGLTTGTIPDEVTFNTPERVSNQMLSQIGVYLDRALDSRPDLAQVRQALMAARYTQYASWGQFSPTVNYTFGYNFTWLQGRNKIHPKHVEDDVHNTGNYSARGGDLTTGISVNWLLFDGGSRFISLRETAASRAAAEYTLEDKWISIIREIRSIYDDCIKTHQMLYLTDQIQSDSLRNRDLVRESYLAGNVDFVRMNEAQTALVQAQSDYAKAKINLLTTRARLAAATGSN